MRGFSHSFPITLTVVHLGMLLTLGSAAANTFRVVADDSGQFDSFPNGPVINDHGTVAFFADLDNGETGLFLGAALTLPNVTKLIADTSEAQFTGLPSDPTLGQPAINDSRQVAFVADLTSGQGIYIRDGTVGDPSTAQTEIANTSSNPEMACDYDQFNRFIFMNDPGTVAYTSQDGGSNGSCVFTGSGGTPTCRVGPMGSSCEDSTGMFDRPGAPSVNDSGTIAFAGALAGGGEAVACQAPGQSLAKLCDTNSTCDGFNFSAFGPAVINNDDFVVVNASVSGGSGIYLMDCTGAGVTEIDFDSSALFSNQKCINDSEEVVYKKGGTLRLDPDPMTSGSQGVITPPGGVGTSTACINEQSWIAATGFDNSKVFVAIPAGVPVMPIVGYAFLAGTLLSIGVAVSRSRRKRS